MCDKVLVYLTSARMNLYVWLAIERQFITKSSMTETQSLFSKKVELSIKEYMTKIMNMCDVFTTVGIFVLDSKQINIILVGLPIKYDYEQISLVFGKHSFT